MPPFSLLLQLLDTLVQALHLVLQLLQRPEAREDGLDSLVELVLHLLELLLRLVDQASASTSLRGRDRLVDRLLVRAASTPGMSRPMGPSRRSASTFSVRAWMSSFSVWRGRLRECAFCSS